MFPVRDTVPVRHPPIATWLLIIANGVVFFFELTLEPDALQDLIRLFGIVPARYTHPAWAAWAGFPVDDYWPFLTSMFLHGSWLHLVGNMWTLWIFGDNVEDRMGPGRFAFFYLSCGLAAGVVHWLTSPQSTLPTVGASGAIAGVMGAYYLLFPRARVVILVPVLFLPFFFELPAVTYLAFWAFTQVLGGTFSLASAGQVGMVAWWAHAGGFLAGMVLQLAFVPRGAAYRRPARDEYSAEGAWLPDGYWKPSS
jgi:membrane associated rhomboid family serine protease